MAACSTGSRYTSLLSRTRYCTVLYSTIVSRAGRLCTPKCMSVCLPDVNVVYSTRRLDCPVLYCDDYVGCSGDKVTDRQCIHLTKLQQRTLCHVVTFPQAVMKQLHQIGLKKMFAKNKSFQNFVYNVLALAYVPPSQVTLPPFPLRFGVSGRLERISTNVKDRKNDVFRRFLSFFGVFLGSDPNVMDTIETGSSMRFRKGLYHFCSSNGLVSAAD